MLIKSYSSTMDFFRNQIKKILLQSRFEITESTEFYIVNLLTELTRTDQTHANYTDLETPLALIYADAVSAQSLVQKYKYLKTLGDHSLYVSGFFGDSLKQKIVDTDYYIEMGKNAYHALSELTAKEEFIQAYTEMAVKFQFLVDILAQLSEEFACTSDEDLLRLYDRWLHTKSQRLLQKLKAQGIDPDQIANKKGIH